MQVRERKDNEGFFFYLTHSFSVLFIFIFIYIYFFLPSLYFENSIIHWFHGPIRLSTGNWTTWVMHQGRTSLALVGPWLQTRTESGRRTAFHLDSNVIHLPRRPKSVVQLRDLTSPGHCTSRRRIVPPTSWAHSLTGGQQRPSPRVW